ncbi:hypothetical protein ABFS82_12G097300 [Erythranthe guttata]|uniref:uncharacterized protein LOC105967667 n=1 Tax=Erythranthe guttata TaxID=4155 RepID=UPI00064DAE8B|nr:PREDICTED: uncharacterized protein LOC105967667 [Erythranthe guttata]|eukprot:XP_012847738.1 PREDICTED: uncharacterized protein LOC105967667 [Erythranthe guttata]
MENPEEFADWEQIQSPFSAINTAAPSIFPPRNHEDLPISNENRHSQEQEPSIGLLLPSSESDDDGVLRRWIRLRLGDAQIGIFRFAGTVGKYVPSKGAFRSFAWTSGGVAAAVLLVWFLHRRILLWWRRRVQLKSGNESLVTLVREKDERINQLLLQIATMNEILLARRRVPVIRVKRINNTR